MEKIGSYVQQSGLYDRTAQAGADSRSARTSGARNTDAAKEGKTGAALSTDELEKMAADEDVKKKNMGILDNAVAKLDDMKAKLGDKADDVTRIGISIGDNGEVSFFAELEKNSEKQRERIEKCREEKRDNAHGAGYGRPDRPAGKRTTVFAPTVEQLAEKISQVDWSKVKEEKQDPVGQRFDLTI